MPLILAHDGPHGLASEMWQHWTAEPVTILLLLLSAACYAIGLQRLWTRAGPGVGIRKWEAGAFCAGLLTIAIALLSPLAWVSEALFSAHMTQHEILMLISAPLLVFGRPLQVFMWAVDSQARGAIGRWTRRPAVTHGWRAITGPTAAFLLHLAALWLWHIPFLYEAALGSTFVHALQHASFLLTAALFWWGMIYGRYGRIGYGVGAFYVFVTAVHSSLLGALMTIAPSLWYRWYAASGATWHVDALADQQLAGLLMWVPSGVIFIVLGLALLAAWIGESERRAQLGSISR